MIPNQNEKQPTIDYRTIAAMPISKRQQYVQNKPEVITLLTPGQIASLFPKAYQDWAGSSKFTTDTTNETKVASLNEPAVSSDLPIPGVPPTAQPVEQSQINLTGSNTNKAYQFFRSKGWNDAQARGIVGNLMGESGPNLDQWANKGSEDAFGIAQWHSDRRAYFEKQFGKPMSEASLEEQLQFVDWEFNNTEKAAGDALRNATSPEEATWAVTKYYERPADPEGDYKTRVGYATGLQPETDTASLEPDNKTATDSTSTDSGATMPANTTPAQSLEYQKLLDDQVNNSSQFGLAGTAEKQGLKQSLARMHPEYLRRAEAVQKQLKEAGLPAYLYSNYRPKEFDVNNHKGWSSDQSMHGFGLASDWGGITGSNGRLLLTPEQYQKFSTIMEANGFYRPWKSDAERNHWQIVPQKTVDNPEIVKLRDQWAKSNYSDDSVKHKLDVAINNYYKLGPEADSLVNPQITTPTADDLIQQAQTNTDNPSTPAKLTATGKAQTNPNAQLLAEGKGQSTGAQETATVVPAAVGTSAQQVSSIDTNPLPTASKIEPVKALPSANTTTQTLASNTPSIQGQPDPYKQPNIGVPVTSKGKMTTASVGSDFNPMIAPSSVGSKSLDKAFDRSDFGGIKGLGDYRGI